jgi:hypothetical protein
MKVKIYLFSLAFNFLYVTPGYASSSVQSYRKALETGGFGSALTSGTTLTRICSAGAYDLVLYDNAPPETQHENTGLVIFRNRLYSHDYGADMTHKCRCSRKLLTCISDDLPRIRSVIKLSDLIRGNRILLSGEVYDAYRGTKRLHPELPPIEYAPKPR